MRNSGIHRKGVQTRANNNATVQMDTREDVADSASLAPTALLRERRKSHEMEMLQMKVEWQNEKTDELTKERDYLTEQLASALNKDRKSLTKASEEATNLSSKSSSDTSFVSSNSSSHSSTDTDTSSDEVRKRRKKKMMMKKKQMKKRKNIPESPKSNTCGVPIQKYSAALQKRREYGYSFKALWSGQEHSCHHCSNRRAFYCCP
uniref:uncharacterized protein LOC109965143 isoform X2 n=1 Tax=Monopterus albus TaxID=43700 RepID=UPI0009B2EE23|nr:uncharacterized protein LOC109965143 isoform X2 [Monopterus albus]